MILKAWPQSKLFLYATSWYTWSNDDTMEVSQEEIAANMKNDIFSNL